MKLSISKNINYRFIVINIPNILNILIPILLIPIVITSTGIEEFGRVIFYQGIIGILLLISENGLNTISLTEFDKTNSNRIVFHTIVIKLLIAILLLSLIIFFIPSKDTSLFLILYFLVLGQAFNVSYLYIFNKNETIYSLLLIIVKLISVSLFLIFFKDNILVYAMFIGFSEILVGLFSLLFSGCLKKITTIKLNFDFFKLLFLRGLNYTKINLLSSGYSMAPPIYLKIFLGFEIIGIYGAIEKVYKGFCNLSAPFNLILLGERKFKSLFNFFQQKQVKIFFSLFVFSLIILGFFAEYFMIYLLPEVNYKTYQFSFLFSLLIPIIVFFSRILVINFYVKNSLEKMLLPIYLRVFLISIPIIPSLIYLFGLTGCIIGILIIEIFCLFKLKLNYFKIY